MNIEQLNGIKNRATLLHDPQTIEQALERLAEKLNRDFALLNPVFVVVMNGGLVFAGKLIPKLNFPAQVDYCHATRYRDNTTGGKLVWKAKPQMDLKGRHVILVDDILDEGHTLHSIIEECERLQVASVKTLVLIEKLHSRKAYKGMKPDYCELTTPDEYVFGYGMDVKHYWRNTDAIYILNPDDY